MYLSSDAIWCEHAITVANNDTIGGSARALFIDRNDTIFIGAYQKNQILIWSKDSVLPVQIDHVNLYEYSPFFVTDNSDIYFQDNSEAGLINKWSMTSHQIIYVVKFTSHCRGLFITDDDTIYCSQFNKHQVVRLSLNTTHENETIVAGTGVSGNATNQLNGPWGIYVDQNLNLFVADFWNNRIQLFESGQLNGTTVAGEGVPQGLILNHPTDMVFDANNNMYIADVHNNRVIRVSRSQWSCVAGCSGRSGNGFNELAGAYEIHFDTFGNLYVADEFNNRIQKFLLRTDVAAVSKQPMVPVVCPEDTGIGRYGNVSNTPCHLLDPCLNNATCDNIHDIHHDYHCSCLTGFIGKRCEIDQRPCRPGVCWNAKNCTSTTNNESICECFDGWEGLHCETRINLCRNISCQNGGICFSTYPNYTCQCLGHNYYYGQHCEFETKKLTFLRNFSKSMSYIAIIVLSATAMFIISMDILKYGFGIDPVKEDLEYVRRKKQAKKRKHVIQRFIYVNAPPPPSKTNRLHTIAEETII